MSRNLKLYLNDIEISINKIQKYTQGMDKETLLKNDLTFDAVVHNLQIIGEATKNIPPDIKVKYPQVPWRNIVGLRNIIAHTYFSLDEDILWDIVQNELEDLKACIQLILIHNLWPSLQKKPLKLPLLKA